MFFMVLIFVFLLVVVVWAFLHYSPLGVNRRRLQMFNGLVLLAAVPLGVIVGLWIYQAGAAFPEKRQYAWYLGLMAGGVAALLLVTVAGLVRNFVLFPLHRRGSGAAGGGSDSGAPRA